MIGTLKIVLNILYLPSTDQNDLLFLRAFTLVEFPKGKRKEPILNILADVLILADERMGW